jgi:hypothetical protein
LLMLLLLGGQTPLRLLRHDGRRPTPPRQLLLLLLLLLIVVHIHTPRRPHAPLPLEPLHVLPPSWPLPQPPPPLAHHGPTDRGLRRDGQARHLPHRLPIEAHHAPLVSPHLHPPLILLLLVLLLVMVVVVAVVTAGVTAPC